MKVVKIGYALLSAIVLTGAVVPTVTVAAATTSNSKIVDQSSSFEEDAVGLSVEAENSEIPMGPEGSLSYPELNALTLYVSVVNNKFVLSLPADNQFSNELIAQAEEQITLSNQLIESGNLVIDTATMAATQTFYADGADVEVRSYGKKGRLKGWMELCSTGL